MLEKLNSKHTTIIFGRANAGTRLIPSSLQASGVFIGEPLNVASDLLPPEPLYEACKLFGSYVDYKGENEWDFSRAVSAKIPDKFLELLSLYLKSLLTSDQQKLAWKLPENTLIFPWLIRVLPKANFIHWVRHPGDVIIKMMGVDRLEKWGIPCTKYWFHEWNYKMRAASWKYHYDIVMDTPKPEKFKTVRFEDFILKHEATIAELSDFLEIDMQAVDVNPKKVGVRKLDVYRKYPFLRNAMDNLSYQ